MVIFKRLNKRVFSGVILAAIILGFFSLWQESPFFLWHFNKTKAQNFQIQTGYYIGSGASNLTISGLGFSPQFVIIKSDTAAGSAVFKTSAMPTANTAFFSATADNTASQLTFTADGFSLGTLTNLNSVNIRYTWIAFSGSDCASAGNFCVGSYTGDGVSPRTINTGFQPDFVMVKRSTAVAGHFRVTSHPVNRTSFFTTATDDTTGAYIQNFTSNGFIVGATDNASGGVYYFVAFKTTTGIMGQGSYSGDGLDNRDITAPGFRPDWVLVKNSTNGTAANRDPLMNINESYGDSSSYIGSAAANVVNGIQALLSGGFQVGSLANVNASGDTFYWLAFSGASPFSSAGGFKMRVGSYTGNGTSQSISGLGFRPDLVIIKGNDANLAVFRTSVMRGDSTAYFSSAAANFAGGITSLDSNGFTVGSSAIVNSSGVVYHWQAFGGAFNPYTNSGSAKFAVGAYYGNGIDNRNIFRLPWQPNLVVAKRNGATVGAWRTSALTGDLSSYFGATAEAANIVQSLNSDGFQIGTNAEVNTAANLYWWFAFQTGADMAVGTYTGTGSSQPISVGLAPSLVWVKRSTAVNGVHRGGSLTGDATQYFVAAANVADRITSLTATGFTVGGAQTETNTSGATYRYAAWQIGGVITASSSGSQAANLDFNSANNYLGGAFTFIRDVGTATVTAITLTETGSVNAVQNLSNVRLYYETATTCQYNGNESLYGSSTNFTTGEKITITGAMPVGTAQICLYIVLNIGSGVNRNQTIDIEISNPSNEVQVSSGLVEPAVAVAIAGSTVIRAPAFWQNYFRFYVDNDVLNPTDPWPVGPVNLGENEPITGNYEPLDAGERVRIRMSLYQNGDLNLAAQTWAFRLQFGQKESTCQAITNWTNLGGPTSGEIWRGYNASPSDGSLLSTNPPLPGDLKLSVSDRAGTYEEDNDTALNPYAVNIGEDMEWDWVIENNGASASTTYCFRMVRADNQTLDGFNYYPEILTAPPFAEGIYWLSIGPVPGSAVSGYVFASFLNPTGSDRYVIVKRIFIQAETVAAANWADMNLRRISAASGGTLIFPADIPKKNFGSATSSMDIRYAGPAVTFQAGTSANAKIMAVAPAGNPGAIYGRKELVFGDNDEKLVLAPGEGVALYQIAAGDADHRIRLSFEWQETASLISSQNEYLLAYPRVEVAASTDYVYHSFFNPAGSGKTAIVKRIWVDVDGDAGAVYTNNITLRRITSVSGGTAIDVSDIPKKNNSSAVSALDFRYSGVSVAFEGAADSRLISLTPPGAADQPHSHYEIHFKNEDEKLILRPGEGIALYSEAAGDVDQLVRLSVEWQEIASPPANQNEYLISIGPVLGQGAANPAYLSFFNPSGSGKTAVVKRIQLRVDAVAAATYVPMYVQRISSASGGTLMNSANIPKKHKNSSDSAIQIRTAPGLSLSLTGNAGVASLLEVTAPAVVAQIIGHQEIIFDDNEKLVLAPGQGIAVLAEGTDDTDHRVRLLIEWREVDSGPSSEGEFLMAIGQVNGSTSANYNYLSFFNPDSSKKSAVIKRVALRIDTVAAAVYIPMILRRITAASSGTPILASDIPKKNSSSNNSLMDIRLANPSVSFSGSSDSRLTSVTSPGAVGTAVAPALTGYRELVFKNEEKLILRPGEGIVLYQEGTGDADFRARLIMEWDEEDSAPANEGEYLFSGPAVSGSTSSGYVYGSFFNPLGSESAIKIKRLAVRVSAAAAAVYIPITARKIATSSGGVLINSADIPKKNSESGGSKAEIRHSGPTVGFSAGADSRLLGVLTPGAAGQINGLYEAVLIFNEELVLVEGEGLALFQEEAGDADFRVFFQISWQEEAPKITVGAAGAHQSSLNFNSSDNYVGGAFTFSRNTGQTTVNAITLTDLGTVNAEKNLSDVYLYFETAAVCQYDGNESFFGSSTAFTTGEKITIAGSMPVGTAQICLYVVLDIGHLVSFGEYLKIAINDPSIDVQVSGGSVGPGIPVSPSGSAYIRTPAFWQNYFRFYVDNNALIPTDPWPAGTADLNENQKITLNDDPLAAGERVRIRMSLHQNGELNLPAQLWSFKLQFGEKQTNCQDITEWTDLGALASSTIWRGYNGAPTDGTPLSGNPPDSGDLKLSVSDRAGTYEEENDTALNPYAVNINEDMEWDWLIENNGALASSTYCFRMIRSDGASLAGFNYYPEITTAGFRPKSQNWRWYDDEENETPNSPLAPENTAPIEIANENIIKLRLTIKETAAVSGHNIKFKLQFSQYSDFSQGVQDVVEIGNCQSNSLWCYANGAGNDNQIIATRLLSDSNANGVHNESGVSSSSYLFATSSAAEFEFTIKQAGARANAVYFFRAYDIVNNRPVVFNTGATYPSLTTESSRLVFTVNGLPAGLITEGIITDATTTATSVPFGILKENQSVKVGQRLNIYTNATEGYQIFVYQNHGLLNENNDEIPAVAGVNANPVSWENCWQSATSSGCFGYHTGDDVLSGGSTRFLADNTYARFETGPEEIGYNSGPADEFFDFIYRVEIRNFQMQGIYQSAIGFIVVTIF